MSCNKQAFVSKKELLQYFHDKSRSRNVPASIRPYKCQRCEYWHTTSQSKSASKRYKAKIRKLQKGN